jgi:two-component system response regulator FixJ
MPDLSTAISVLVIDDNEDDIRLLDEWLTRLEGWQVTLHALLDPGRAVEKIRQARPELVFLDYRMGPKTGLEVLRELRSAKLFPPVIVLTGQGDEYIASEITQAGADAYLVKDDLPTPRLADTMRRVMEQARQSAPQREEQAQTLERLDLLTPREREVLDELVAGLTNKEVAAKLHRSVETIKVHRAHIMAKIQAESTADLVRRVMTARLG